jgi:ABC-type transport system involved in multi-copper enzyme maturation permease subunit
MPNVLKSDFYRFATNNKFLYGLATFVSGIAFLLVMMVRSDISLGIGGSGIWIIISEIDDIIQMGIQFHNGLLGVVVAVLISVFIGQEYQWKTLQNKWITSQNRSHIYLSKMILSSFASAVIFLVYQLVALLSSGQIGSFLTSEYAFMLICGLFIYATLGTVICLIAMSVKNNVAGVVICLCYVLFIETLLFAVSNLANVSATAGRVVDWGIRHSIYGMATVVSSVDFSPEHTFGIVINALIIMALSTVIGLLIFRKHEL